MRPPAITPSRPHTCRLMLLGCALWILPWTPHAAVRRSRDSGSQPCRGQGTNVQLADPGHRQSRATCLSPGKDRPSGSSVPPRASRGHSEASDSAVDHRLTTAHAWEAAHRYSQAGNGKTALSETVFNKPNSFLNSTKHLPDSKLINNPGLGT